MLFVSAGQFVLLHIPAVHADSQSLQSSVRTNKDVFLIDELVGITITVSNRGSENATLQFSDTCQASFGVKDSSGVSWYEWRSHCLCAQVLTSFVLAPGQSHDFQFLWDQLSDNGIHVFAPANYVITGRVLVASWSGGQIPAPSQTTIGIQSGVVGDMHHAAVVEPLSSEQVLLAPWALLASFTVLYFAFTLWGRRTATLVSPRVALKQSVSKGRLPVPDILRISRWLSVTGGSLILLNGLFFANLGYLLSSSYLSETGTVGEIILLGVVASLAGLGVILFGLMLGSRPARRFLLGVAILTLSVFSFLGFVYFYNRLGFYAVYPAGLALGNFIAAAGGILALGLKRGNPYLVGTLPRN